MFVFIVGILIHFVINYKGELAIHANIKIFVQIEKGTLPPPRKICYLLVVCWVQVFGFVHLLSTGVPLGRTERLMA